MKVTLDGVEFTTVPASGCIANKINCFFFNTSIKSCKPRLGRCNGGTPETQIIFLDDAKLLQYLTKRIAG